jgi:hypothetical protein
MVVQHRRENGSCSWRHHLTGQLSLVNDQRFPKRAHRIELNNYGSEGWEFESLRARKIAGQGHIRRNAIVGRCAKTQQFAGSCLVLPSEPAFFVLRKPKGVPGREAIHRSASIR